MIEIIIIALLSVLIVSRLLRALGDLSNEARTVCPALASLIDKALLSAVDEFLKAQGYLPSAKHAEALQRLSIEEREHNETAARVDELITSLGNAGARLQELQSELNEARRSSRSDPALASLQAALAADPVLVVAVQRAFRKRFHPDGRPEAEKEWAETQFKKYEDVFDKLLARAKAHA